MAERDNASVIERAKAGDTQAIDDLLEAQQPRVWRYALKMCRNRTDAEEVMQNTLLAVARSIGQFRGEGALTTWIYTIARRSCVREQSRASDAMPLDAVEAVPSPAPGPEAEAGNRQLGDALNAAIYGLDRQSREVLVLRDVEGLSAAEVSNVTGLSIGAVKSRLHRSRLKVREAMTPMLDTPAHAPRPGCPDVLSAYSSLEEGDLTADLCAELQAHVDGCLPCSTACDSLKQTLQLCRTGPSDVPEDVRRSVRARLQETLNLTRTQK